MLDKMLRSLRELPSQFLSKMLNPQGKLTIPADLTRDSEHLYRMEKILARMRGMGPRFMFLPLQESYTAETQQMRDAYRVMLREPMVKASLWTKILAVAQLEIQVHPASDSALDKDGAEFVKYVLKHFCKGGSSGVAKAILTHGLIEGYSICEKVVQPVRHGRFAGHWGLAQLKAKDPTWVEVRTDEFRNVTMYRDRRTMENFDPSYFVHYAHMPLYDSPVGMSDLRAAFRAYWLLDTCWQLRAIALERYGLPMMQGTYATPDQRIEVEAALAAMRSQSWVSLPQGALVQAVDIAARGPSDFAAAIADLREEIVISISGAVLQMLQGDVSDGRGSSETHRNVSELLQWMLASDLGQVVSDQIVPDLIDVNFPAGCGYPTVTFGGVNDNSMQASVGIDSFLFNSGIELSREEIYERYGRQKPSDDADRLINPAYAPQQPQPGAQFPAGGFGYEDGGEYPPDDGSQPPDQGPPPQGPPPAQPGQQMAETPSKPGKPTVIAPPKPKANLDTRAAGHHSAALMKLQQAVHQGTVPREAAIANARVSFGIDQRSAEALFPGIQRPAETFANGDTSIFTGTMKALPNAGKVPMFAEDDEFAEVVAKTPTGYRLRSPSGHEYYRSDEQMRHLHAKVNRLAKAMAKRPQTLIKKSAPITGTVKDEPGAAQVPRGDKHSMLVQAMARKAKRDAAIRKDPRAHAVAAHRANIAYHLNQLADHREKLKFLGIKPIGADPVEHKIKSSLRDIYAALHKIKTGAPVTERVKRAWPYSENESGVRRVTIGRGMLARLKALRAAKERGDVGQVVRGEANQPASQPPPPAPNVNVDQGGSGDQSQNDEWLDPADDGNLGTEENRDEFGGNYAEDEDQGESLTDRPGRDNFDLDFIGDTDEVTDPSEGNNGDLADGESIAGLGGEEHPEQRADPTVEPYAEPTDVAGSHADADKAQKLLNASEQQGVRVLSEITAEALRRLAAAGQHSVSAVGMKLFDDYEFKRLVRALADSAATAELLGHTRVHTLADRARVAGDVEHFSDEPAFSAFADTPLHPMAPERAVSYFAKLVPGLSTINAVGFADAVKERAFKMAVTTANAVLAKIKDAILGRMKSGQAFRGAPAEIDEVLDDAGISPRRPHYSETVWRTNMMHSYTHGSMDAMRDPNIADVFPAWQYSGIMDGRQRPGHAMHFGKLYPNTVDFAEVRDWSKHGEFSGFNCRCVPRPVSKYELRRLLALGRYVEQWPPRRAFSESSDYSAPTPTKLDQALELLATAVTHQIKNPPQPPVIQMVQPKRVTKFVERDENENIKKVIETEEPIGPFSLFTEQPGNAPSKLELALEQQATATSLLANAMAHQIQHPPEQPKIVKVVKFTERDENGDIAKVIEQNEYAQDEPAPNQKE